jgi:hypothetical protein
MEGGLGLGRIKDGVDGSYEVSGGPLEAFPTIGLQKEAYMKIYKRM